MPSLMIPDVDSDWLKRLEVRAQANGRSIEEEARTIIEERVLNDNMEKLRRASDESLARFRGRVFSDSTADIREDRER